MLPVIKDLADNETDYIIQDYYEKIIYSTNRSIIALNNLVSPIFIIHSTIFIQTSSLQIAALEKNNDVGEEVNAGSVGSEEVDDQCKQSDKAVKLSALKLQIELTYGDVQAIETNSL